MEPDLTAFEASGLSWVAESLRAPAIRAEIAERLAALDDVPGAAVLKENLVRKVLRVPLAGGGRVIVKRYAVDGVLDWLKYAVVPSRAKAEWDVGRGLAAAGIATAVPLAMGERRRLVLRDAALVTREIEDALHLNAYVAAHASLAAGPHREALYDDLARVVRRLHDAGFVHNDLHGGNVLVNGAPGAASIHVIDLHSVTRTSRPREAARWFDLVKLLHSLLTCTTPAERERICRVYDDTGGPSGLRIRALAARGELSAVLEPELERMELKRVKSRTERALTRSSKFDVTRAAGRVMHHLRAVPAAAISAAVSAHDASLGRGGAAVLKDADRSAITRQTLAAPEGPRSVVVKEFRGASWIERVKDAVRRPRAVSSWMAGNGLVVRRFDAAEPLALLLAGRGLAQSSAYLVMEDLGEGSRLDLVVLARFAGALGAEERREKRALVTATARLFRALHAADVYHGDLKAVNLFVRETPRGPSVVLADYDRVDFDRAVSRRRRIKNLAQLSASVAICVTLTDRLRFFREYAADDAETLAAWKPWFRRVIAECERKIVVRMQPIE